MSVFGSFRPEIGEKRKEMPSKDRRERKEKKEKKSISNENVKRHFKAFEEYKRRC